MVGTLGYRRGSEQNLTLFVILLISVGVGYASVSAAQLSPVACGLLDHLRLALVAEQRRDTASREKEAIGLQRSSKSGKVPDQLVISRAFTRCS